MSKTQKIIFFLPASFFLAAIQALSLAWHPVTWSKAKLKSWQGPKHIVTNLWNFLLMGLSAVLAIPLFPLYFTGAFLFSSAGLLFKRKAVIDLTKRKGYFQHLLLTSVMRPFLSQEEPPVTIETPNASGAEQKTRSITSDTTHTTQDPTMVTPTPSKTLNQHSAAEEHTGHTAAISAEQQKTLDEQLREAVQSGTVEDVKSLLQQGANVNYINEESENCADFTPLHFAVMRDVDIVNALIEHKADLEAKTYLGETPLIVAVQDKNHCVVEKLITNGAAIMTKSRLMQTTVDYAAKLNEKQILNTLLKHVNELITLHSGYTPTPNIKALVDKHNQNIQSSITPTPSRQ